MHSVIIELTIFLFFHDLMKCNNKKCLVQWYHKSIKTLALKVQLQKQQMKGLLLNYTLRLHTILINVYVYCQCFCFSSTNCVIIRVRVSVSLECSNKILDSMKSILTLNSCGKMQKKIDNIINDFLPMSQCFSFWFY